MAPSSRVLERSASSQTPSYAAVAAKPAPPQSSRSRHVSEQSYSVFSKRRSSSEDDSSSTSTTWRPNRRIHPLLASLITPVPPRTPTRSQNTSRKASASRTPADSDNWRIRRLDRDRELNDEFAPTPTPSLPRPPRPSAKTSGSMRGSMLSVATRTKLWEMAQGAHGTKNVISPAIRPREDHPAAKEGPPMASAVHVSPLKLTVTAAPEHPLDRSALTVVGKPSVADVFSATETSTCVAPLEDKDCPCHKGEMNLQSEESRDRLWRISGEAEATETAGPLTRGSMLPSSTSARTDADNTSDVLAGRVLCSDVLRSLPGDVATAQDDNFGCSGVLSGSYCGELSEPHAVRSRASATLVDDHRTVADIQWDEQPTAPLVSTADPLTKSFADDVLPVVEISDISPSVSVSVSSSGQQVLLANLGQLSTGLSTGSVECPLLPDVVASAPIHADSPRLVKEYISEAPLSSLRLVKETEGLSRIFISGPHRPVHSVSPHLRQSTAPLSRQVTYEGRWIEETLGRYEEHPASRQIKAASSSTHSRSLSVSSGSECNGPYAAMPPFNRYDPWAFERPTDADIGVANRGHQAAPPELPKHLHLATALRRKRTQSASHAFVGAAWEENGGAWRGRTLTRGRFDALESDVILA
ncbi:hypothetical protein BD414DRAFT_580142 [Trametes punicea]|nr:hypothetical protein BD414DRAFT_580142 [Trametes punicea]